ncbi:MAG: helix-turn-helix transcriptional regulator [Clostridia bacterium]|nr:helix-turn-helix transcriptional regulator [Clostridia bacterium]
MIDVTNSPYSARLSELRKARNLSQKQASNDLGISQALLSHYEKGIREPGLDFIVKAADYYEVSCDYILGHATSNSLLNRNESIVNVESDKDLSEMTIIRAALAVGKAIEEHPDLQDYYFQILTGATYMINFAAVKNGALPRTWLGNGSDNPAQLKFLANSMSEAIDSVPDAIGEAEGSDQTPPQCVSTLSAYINDFINLKVAELM